VLTSLDSPRLNAAHEFGKLAARLHAAKFVGGLDITNCKFEPDGTLIAMFSIGRGRILEHPLTIEERAKDLVTVKEQVSAPAWEAVKLGYRFSAPDDAEEVLAKVEPPTPGLGASVDSWEKYLDDGKKAFEECRGEEAERLFAKALSEGEKFGPDDLRLAVSLHYLGKAYAFQSKYSEAKLLVERSLAIWEKVQGTDHPNVAAELSNLANIHESRGNHSEAEMLHKRVIAIWEKALGSDHPNVGHSLSNLGTLYKGQGKYAEAEPLYLRAIAIHEKALGPEHAFVAGNLTALAKVYADQAKFSQAEPLYQRALAIWEKSFDLHRAMIRDSLENYAVLLRKTNRLAEAEEMEARAKAIRVKQPSENSPQ
jgi:tetratricopeptide (TPR) repeat protein